ncbi:EXO5-like protein [Mya arenaria]|uniref:EXO5-like protein n=1 Tax=Mya arenaria TaxID=6604 RepID=A0ABY7DXE7_MYAAR|nr:EXO5-like protein [Mya arenaria]
MRMISVDENEQDVEEVLKNGTEIAASDTSNAEGSVQLISTLVKRKRGKDDLCSELEDDGLPDNLEKIESCETDFAEEFTENDLSVVATLEKTLESPLSSFRPGYLWVSDLTRQNWCEQQLYYSFTVPGLVEEKPVMTEGTNLHLERVTSNEDIWGIKVLNLINSLQGFLNGGTVAREIPIFGAPFNEGVFIVGLIDELRFDPEMYLMELWELKTRKRKSMPSKAQCVQHRLQVMLYKKLFDDLVKGNLAKETVAKHLRLDLKKTFGDDVVKQVTINFLTSKDLSELMDVLFSKVQCLTCIQEIGVEYVHQDSKGTIGMCRESYSDEELEKLYKEYLKFWRGERCSTGVDIEDAWKCQSCDFADICDWRKKKAEEYSKKNIHPCD